MGTAIQQYDARASAICDADGKQSDALGSGPSQPLSASTLSLYGNYMKSLAAVGQHELAQLRALPRPAGLPNSVNAFYAQLQEAVTALDGAVARANSHDLAGFQAAFGPLGSMPAKATSLAKAAGIPACGQ